MECAASTRRKHRPDNVAAHVRQRFLLAAASSLLPCAPAPALALDGVRQPDRLEQAITVTCGGSTGSVLIEETFERSPEVRRQVKLRRVVPLGAVNPVKIDASLPPLFDRMIRVDRLQWFCDGREVAVSIRYIDRAAWANHVDAREAGLYSPRPGNMTLYLDLTRSGLVAQGPPSADEE